MSRYVTYLAVVCALSILPMCASMTHAAAPIVARCPVAIAAFVAQGPEVDGTLSDEGWKQAPKLGPFVTIAGGPAKSETYATILRSADTLFVGIVCGTAEGAELKCERTERDTDVWMDESVEVFVAAGVSARKYFHFIANVSNVQHDEICDKLATRSEDPRWNGTWQSATSRDATAWYAEFAIPFTTLGLTEGGPALIGLNICRNDYTTNDKIAWAATINGFHQPARFGVASLPNKSAPPRVSLDIDTIGEPELGANQQNVRLNNASNKVLTLSGLVIVADERERVEEAFALAEVAAGSEATTEVSYNITRPGLNAVVIAARDAQGSVVAASKFSVLLHEEMYRQYGYRIRGGEKLGLWWAESTYKIRREQTVPSAAANEVEISAAGHEYEAAQIVVNPAADVDVSVRVSDFRGDRGKIAAENFELFEVAYVPVNVPTDSFGWVGDWPDPLQPISGPVHCAAGQNQPFWLLAYVPPGTAAGIYHGQVEFAAGDKSLSVPVRLQVYDFELTPETHTRTAYGVSPDFGFLGVKDADQKRDVYDLYMQSCRDHRISPYGPMRFYPMHITSQFPMSKFTCGRLAVEITEGQKYPWTLYWDGEQVANQNTSMTHFEKEGVGYEGTGVGWPYIDCIESITEVSSSENMRIVDVVGARTGSAPATRSFKLTFRFFIPAGDNWFAIKLMKMESTDATEIEVRNYYNIPRTTFQADEVANGEGFAAWSGDGIGFGMMCLAGAAGGLHIEAGGNGVTVSNPVSRFRIKNGETHDGWGPLVVYFLTDATSSEALAAHAAELRERIDSANPADYVPSEHLQISEQTRPGHSFTHDFTDFDKGASRYLDRFHFNGFRVHYVPSQIAGHPRFTDEYKRLHKMMYGPVIEHLREKGWLKWAYSYWLDEPSEEQYPEVIAGMKLLGENCPGLTRLLTEQPEAPLEEVVDLWVPVLYNYRPDRCQARQAAGDEVWWYVCCGPRAPYPNNFIDHPAINHRIRFWMAEQYGVTGSLYWSATYYGKLPDKTPRNPWIEAMSYSGGGGHWGNGDGMLLYPACRERSETPVLEGPVVSIRWEILRDGIEDREYFWILRQEMARLEAMRPAAKGAQSRLIDTAIKRADKALTAPDRLAESPVVYTKDPQDLLRQRARIAKAIEACRRIN